MNDHNQYIKPIPTWLWMFAVLSVTMFSGLLYYLDQYEKGKVTSSEGLDIKELFVGSKNTQQNASGEKSEPGGGTKPNFEFYSLLRDLEVIVPDSEIPSVPPVEKSLQDGKQSGPENNLIRPTTPSPPAPQNTQLKKNTPSNQEPKFFVQAGSFKDYATADKMKANLALLGVVANIESVKIPKSGTWHRVRVGPFKNKQQISKVRRILKRNHIDSITVRIKG